MSFLLSKETRKYYAQELKTQKPSLGYYGNEVIRVRCAGECCHKFKKVSPDSVRSWLASDPARSFEMVSSSEESPFCEFCRENEGRGAGILEFEEKIPRLFLEGSTATNENLFPPEWKKISLWSPDRGLVVDGEVKRSLYICGKFQVGKSRMLFELLRRLVAGRFNVKILRAGEFRNSFLKLYDKNYSAAAAWVDELIESDILAFDDLGKEVLSENMVEELFRLFDRRLLDGKPAIVVSNYAPDELPALVHDRGAAAASMAAIVERIVAYSAVVLVKKA